MESVVDIAPTAHTISFIDLILNASLLVQIVMAVLVLASVVSWTMIFYKWFTLRIWIASASEFYNDFWTIGDMTEAYNRWKSRDMDKGALSVVFVEGYEELVRVGTPQNVDKDDVVEGVNRVMHVALSRSEDSINSNLSFLATVGSTSPYIGLFGTVWGIMNSFRGLSSMQSATIAAVAPGIAEALIATAMGLFAAIPAVIAYNRFSYKAARLMSRYESFIEEFLNIVSRHYAGRR